MWRSCTIQLGDSEIIPWESNYASHFTGKIGNLFICFVNYWSLMLKIFRYLDIKIRLNFLQNFTTFLVPTNVEDNSNLILYNCNPRFCNTQAGVIFKWNSICFSLRRYKASEIWVINIWSNVMYFQRFKDWTPHRTWKVENMEAK